MAPPDPKDARIMLFMKKAASELGCELAAPKDVFKFGGSNPVLSDRFLGFAIEGKKSATTSWPIPDPLYWGPGDLSVILNSAGEPSAVMRTLSFVKCKFKDVAEDFALAEGEGDYEEYRQGHIDFYRREEENGHEFGDESMVLCERFEIIYPITSKPVPANGQ